MLMPQSSTNLQSAFGLLETSIITIVIGIAALFAIPRYEARAETQVTAKALRYVQAVWARQQALQVKGLPPAEHLDQFASNPQWKWVVPHEFLVDEFGLDSQGDWFIVVKRRALDCVFGDYTIVYDADGFNRSKSTLPPALLREAKKSIIDEDAMMWGLVSASQGNKPST